MNSYNSTPQSQLKAMKRLRFIAALASILLGITFAYGEQFFFGIAQTGGPAPEELAADRREAESSMPRLPADIEDRLEAARTPQLIPVAIALDPFLDKSGVTNPKAPETSQGGPTSSAARNSGSLRVSAAAANKMPVVPTVPDLNARVEEWRRNYRAARESGTPLPEKTRIYLLSELTPIGRFATNGKVDVWFKLSVENRTFPASVGTKFYDGELIGIIGAGPVFRLSNGTVRTINYAEKEDFITTTREESGRPPLLPAPSPTTTAPERKENDLNGQRPPESPVEATQKEKQSAIRKIEPKALAASLPQPPVSEKSAPASAGQDQARVGESSSMKLLTTIPITAVLPLFDPANNERAQASLGKPNPFGTLPDTYRPSGNNLRRFGDFMDHRIGSRGGAATPTPTPPVEALPANATQQDGPQTTAPEKAVEKKEPPDSKPATPVMTIPSATYETQTVTKSPETGQTAKKVSNLSPLCDPNYKADLIDTEFTSATTLGNLVDKFNTEFGANIILDNDVQEIPIRLTITNVPWTQFLHLIMDLNDLGQVCLEGRLVGIAKRTKLAQMEDQKKKNEPITQEIFHLKYLQPVVGGRVNLAGQAQGGQGATIQSLEDAIRAILRASGDVRADVRRVPGRNELLVAATSEQLKRVRDLIARVDRPGYQVLIKALVYTANENRLRDIGSQFSIIAGNASQFGGFSTIPNTTTTTGSTGGTTGGGGTGGGTGGCGCATINCCPGGTTLLKAGPNAITSTSATTTSTTSPSSIAVLPNGFTQPSGGLSASAPLMTFGFGSIFGTAQFTYQLTLAQQKGVVNVQSRPFGLVTDGDTFDLAAGTQIPVVTSAIAGGATVSTGNVQFIEASRIARITPQVAETEDGKAGYVTLNIQLENNVVDTSLGLFNGLPGVNRQSLQTVLRLHDGETAVIGGLAADSVSNATSKVPGAGDLPVVGNLFKRKTNQESRDRLYFAITVQVIPQEAPLINVPAPTDAITSPPPPPRAQRPSPFEQKEQKH